MKLFSLFAVAVLSLLLSLLSCRKDAENDNGFPKTLYFSKLTPKSGTRLFSNKVEITDPGVISRFVSDSNYSKPESANMSSTRLIFYNADSALVPASPPFSSACSVVKNGDQFLFLANATYYVPALGGEALIKFTGPEEIPPNSFGGYYTKEINVGRGSYTNLDLSFLAYKVVTNDTRGNVTYSSTLMDVFCNEFNENFIQKLGPRDTLAVQSYTATMVAR